MTTIYDRIAKPDLLRTVVERCRNIDMARKTHAVVDALNDIAADLKITRRKVRDLAKKGARLSAHPLRVVGNDINVPIARVITAKGFESACLCALRTYPGTLKGLELPGYVITDGDRRILLTDLRKLART